MVTRLYHGAALVAIAAAVEAFFAIFSVGNVGRMGRNLWIVPRGSELQSSWRGRKVTHENHSTHIQMQYRIEGLDFHKKTI